MALTYTPSPDLQTPCPDFQLKAVDGKSYGLKDFSGASALVIMFICNHCPYVQAIEDRLLMLARDYLVRGVRFVGICSNDPTDHPDDRPAELLKRATEKGYPFPYLIDSEQTVAQAFGAVCTPDFFVYDAGQRLAYRGRLDDSWRNPQNVRRQELKTALDALLANQPVPSEQNPSMGCSIKWKND